MKYVLLFLATVASLAYIRHRADKLARAMYKEGCEDAAALLARQGKIDESADIMLYCTWKHKALKEWL